jgi:TRAP-type C4-dicarboxylate transport system permease small subunit
VLRDLTNLPPNAAGAVNVATRPCRRADGVFYAAYASVRTLNGLAVGAACGMIVLMVLLTDWGTITRYFLRSPATWTYPVTTYLLLYSTYLALAYTLQEGEHVRVEFLVEQLSPALQRWMDRLGHILGAAFTVVFLHQTWRLFTRHLTEGQRDMSMLGTPLWIMSAGLVIGLAIMVVTYFFVLIDSFLTPVGSLTVQDRERRAIRDEEQVE